VEKFPNAKQKGQNSIALYKISSN